MKKDEAESAIRHLCHVWARETGVQRQVGKLLSFGAFRSWLDDRGYDHYLDFRSVRGARADAEAWFDQEMSQSGWD